MQTKRTDALKELKGLAKEITKSQEFSSNRTPEEDLFQTGTFANTDGTKPWLLEINELREAIKSKVRRQLIHSWTFVFFIHFACFYYLSAGITSQA